MSRYRPHLLLMGLIFVSILLQIFFSGIQDKATGIAQVPVLGGYLQQTIDLKGHVVARNPFEVAATATGMVKKRYCKSGDYIEKGQPLLQSEHNEALEEIVSPISGYIIAQFIEEGDNIIAKTRSHPGNIIATIADPNHLRFVAALPEKETRKIKVNTMVQVQIGDFNQAPFHAKVLGIGKREKNSDTVPIELDLKGLNTRVNAKLRPGFVVSGRIVTRQLNSALFVPKTAVLFHNHQGYVYLPINDEQATRHPVTVGMITNDKVQIKKGLKLGQLVVDLNYYPNVKVKTKSFTLEQP